MERHCTREREANSPIDRGPPLVFKSNTLRVSTFINVYYHSLDNESPINYHVPINGRAESTNESRIGSVAFIEFWKNFPSSSFFFFFFVSFHPHLLHFVDSYRYFALFVLIFLYYNNRFYFIRELHFVRDFLKYINVQIH